MIGSIAFVDDDDEPVSPARIMCFASKAGLVDSAGFIIG